MKTSSQKAVYLHYSTSRFSSLPLALLLFTSNIATAQDLPSLDVIAGRALFEKTWVSAPASTAASDGLGPFFNGRSCEACHPGGGRGTLPEALNFISADPVYGEFLQTRAVQGLRAEAQVKILGANQIIMLEDGTTEVVLRTSIYELSDLRYGALHNTLSARIAPALTGLYLLEQVPEHMLQALADPDDSDGDGISGRVSKVAPPGGGALETGRFGWKAESYSLRMQVARALSLDMGLGNSLFPSAFGDCTVHQPDCLQMAAGNSPTNDDAEVSDTILDLLMVYLHSLAPPQQQAEVTAIGAAGNKAAASDVSSSRANNRSLELNGLSLFNNIGCSACHTPSLDTGNTQLSPFTDLLLHDMGPELAANAVESAEAAEWRTAPLWGLASAQVYLHDGRAATLAEAILWHGGEATGAVTAYSRLTAAEREVLHSWLHGL